jgi:hypothetical protein
VFQDLDTSLRALLTDAAVPPALPGVDITFRTPDKAFTFAQKTLNLFLSGVRENRVLRDPVPIVELVGGSFRRRTPPLRMDCDYLVTAWSKEAGALAVQEEHRLLAQALGKLSRFQALPTTYLQGTMVNQPFPVHLWVAQHDESRSLGEFWSALGVPPRSAFQVSVTIALDLQEEPVVGPTVSTSTIILDDDLLPPTPGETTRTIGGTIRRLIDGAPIVDATVALDGTRTVTTDADGRFRFARVAEGQHQLQAAATGFATEQRAVSVPGTTPTHFDFDLAP